ncbi:MAG: DUF3275 family protein [Candidatus Accumulibacter sp.]|jgi:hypothetical protein|nr:DUF3275 family protein [Accumulibacter sp.]
MITLPGQLSIRTIHGRNGDFNVGRLATSIGEFVIKNAELDQYEEGRYDGSFVIVEIRPASYVAGGRMVIEVRAVLGGMTLSNIDELSGDEAQGLSLQEVDPVDEESAPSAAQPQAPAREKRDPRDPLVDTTPFGSEPAPLSPNAEDEALFGHLWPLGDVVQLDSTVGRLTLRAQRDRLKALGYRVDPLSQDWHRGSA